MAEAKSWEDLKGKYIRAEHTHGEVYRIGHILKDEWVDANDYNQDGE